MKLKYLFATATGSAAIYSGIRYKLASAEDSPALRKVKFDFKKSYLDLQKQQLTMTEMQELWQGVQQSKHVGHISWGELPSGSEKLKQQIEDKLVANNQNYQQHPTDFTYALLSSHAYRDSSVGMPVEFKFGDTNHKYNGYLVGWQVQEVYNIPEAGRYYAASYTNDEDRQLVLAHRGTTVKPKDFYSSDSPLHTDFYGILGRNIVQQQIEAYKATKEAVTYAKENDYSFSTTGHSLGGWLAEVSLYFAVFDFNAKGAKAVTFDSPGSIVVEDYASNIFSYQTGRELRHLDITTYLSAPNFVNTANKHIGKAYRLYPEITKPYIIAKAVGLSDGFFSLFGYKTNDVVNLEPLWSLFGHFLNPLIDTFDPVTGKPREYDQITNWPVIKYTPKQTVGRNMMTEWLGTADSERNKPEESKVVSTLKRIINGTTMETLVGLVEDIKAGRIDQKQYLESWKHLQDEGSKGYPLKEGLGGDKEFLLKYSGRYQTAPVNNHKTVLESKNKGSADWYLKALRKCSIEEIEARFGKDSIETRQLKALKGKFDIEHNLNHYLDTSGSDMTVDQVRQLMTRLVGVNPAIKKWLVNPERVNSAPNTYLKSYIPESEITNFIRHDDEAQKLADILKTSKLAIISGIPGVGKSSFAAEYGRSQDKAGVKAFWFNSDTLSKVETQYLTLAKQLGITLDKEGPIEVMRLVHSKIESMKIPVLFIFDNVEKESYEHIKPYLNDLPKQAKVIITTRHSNLDGSPETKTKISLKGLTKQEAMQYVKNSDIKNKATNDKEVAELVDYWAAGEEVLPFDLQGAISSIKKDSSGGIKDYLELVKKYPRDEARTAIIQKLLSKSELAWPMLQYTSRLDPDFISIDILAKLFVVDRSALNAPIDALESLSAVQIVHDSNGNAGLKMHRSTQGSTLIYARRHPDNSLSEGYIEQNLLRVLDSLFPWVDSIPDQRWKEAKKIASHIKKIVDQDSDAKIPNDLAADLNKVLAANLNAKLGRYFEEVLNSYGESLYYKEQALEMRRELYKDQPHPNLATSLDNVGVAYRTLGDGENALKGLKLQEQALEMRKGLYKDKPHPDLATSLNNVGWAYRELGDRENVEKGLKLYEQALEMRRELYKDQLHPDLAASLNNVGLAYKDLGGQENVQKGLKLQEQALEMYQGLYKGQHPNLAASLNSVGVAYRALGDRENVLKGLELMEQALEMRKELYQDKPHPNLARSLNNVGMTYQGLGGQENMLKGLKLQEQALEMRRELYKDKPHPDLASSLDNVGVAYRGLGDKENVLKGLKLQEQALEMRRELYKDKPHPDLASSLNNVGLAYKALGDKENVLKGLKLQEQALEMRRELYQGQPHLDLAQSLNDVGVAYRGLGDKENALKGLKLQEQALEMYQGFYKGQLHPNLAISLSNVGLAYKALGQTEKGDEYLRQAKEMREKLNQNPTGEGVENYENVSYWNKYAKEGLEHLLKLRIEAADIKDVVVKGLNLVWSDSLTVTERLCSDISNIVKTEQGTVLLPLNLYGKHWTGLVVGKTADKINIHYMDSEQQPMPTLLKEMLIKALTMTNPKQQINITETELELQRYNNCGPEVIENFMQHLTGHRLSQEDTVPIHALLFEDAIMLVGDC
jgi:hypothetical protein